MHLNDDLPGRPASAAPAEPGDAAADVEEPDFPTWADPGEPAAPEIALLSSEEEEPPPPEFPEFWQEPPPPPAPFEEVAPEVFAPPAVADESLPDADISSEAEGAFPNPLIDDAAAPVDEPPDDGRRARLKEWAAQLWSDGPQEGTAATHLICVLDEGEFALPLAGVLEVQRLPAVTPAPHLPDWLLGVANRRGEILSVVDLAGFLGLAPGAPSPSRRLVVVRASREEMTTGLVVDRVCGLRALPAGGLAEPALAVPFVAGVCGEAAVLDLEAMLLSLKMRRPDLD